MNEYVYYSSKKLDFPLNENIKIIDDPQKVNETYIISNSKEVEAEVYAPEINFYIKNTQDSISDMIKNIAKLYEIRSIKLDYATDFDNDKEIGNKLLLVGQHEELIQVDEFFGDDFDKYYVESEALLKIEGTIGELVVHLQRDGKITPLAVDQVIWFNAKDFAFKQNGVFDPLKDGLEEVIERVKQNRNHFAYKKAINYNPDICQYKGRTKKDGGDICGDCANICPTNAILKIDDKKELKFTDEDCETCGGCVSVCPSGALDLAETPREYMYEASNLLKDYKILLIPEVMDIENLEVELPPKVLPLVVGGRKFLHEAHFLSLFQQSGAQVIFYTDFVSKGSKAAIEMVNDITKRAYGVDAILLAMNQDELSKNLQNLQFIEGSRYSFNELGLHKREIFATRLSYLVGDKDLGIYENSNEYIHYGKVVINEQNCTLCLSCVGACNVRALTAHPEDNSLRFNASICTDCTYCEIVCPESDCISVVRDRFELKSDSFKQVIMAQDELFKCEECGKEFAPKKAVMKIAEMMTPMFGGDEAKIRTLYCCENCKAKVMLKAQVSQ